jgi:hypothetical protein
MTTPVAEFQPANDLEVTLMRAQARELRVADLIGQLLESQVVILLDRPLPDSGLWDEAITPLVLTNQSGNRVLAMFTSPDRAVDVASNFPHHSYALLTDFKWVLRGVAPGVGIVVNPGWTVGLEMPPDGVARLKVDADSRPAAH